MTDPQLSPLQRARRTKAAQDKNRTPAQLLLIHARAWARRRNWRIVRNGHGYAIVNFHDGTAIDGAPAGVDLDALTWWITERKRRAK